MSIRIPRLFYNGRIQSEERGGGRAAVAGGTAEAVVFMGGAAIALEALLHSLLQSGPGETGQQPRPRPPGQVPSKARQGRYFDISIAWRAGMRLLAAAGDDHSRSWGGGASCIYGAR
eukprot:scaffold8710_cov118-Isochrysis_galbana.AAC.5